MVRDSVNTYRREQRRKEEADKMLDEIIQDFIKQLDEQDNDSTDTRTTED